MNSRETNVHEWRIQIDPAEAKCREVQIEESEGSIVFGHMEVHIDLDMNSFILYEVYEPICGYVFMSLRWLIG